MEDRGLRRHFEYPWHEQYGGECPGVYYIRLQRDGWQMKYSASDGGQGQVTVFEKQVDPRWVLRKQAHAGSGQRVGRGVYFDTHELRNLRTGAVVPQVDWE